MPEPERPNADRLRVVAVINAKEQRIRTLSDEELRAKTAELQKRVQEKAKAQTG